MAEWMKIYVVGDVEADIEARLPLLTTLCR